MEWYGKLETFPLKDQVYYHQYLFFFFFFFLGGGGVFVFIYTELQNNQFHYHNSLLATYCKFCNIGVSIIKYTLPLFLIALFSTLDTILQQPSIIILCLITY